MVVVDRESVLVSSDGPVSEVLLNRPGRLNAMDAAMSARLIEALAEADAEPDTSVIVLRGAGRAFCAGGDVRNIGGGPTTQRVLHRDWHLHRAILDTEKPIVAEVRGADVGLGLTLALACDVVVVADDAKLGDTHVPLGLLAGDGAVVPLVLGAGPHRTKELLLTGTLVTGDEAARRRFVNRSVPAVELAGAVAALVAEMAAMAPYALRATKQSVSRHIRAGVHELLETALALEMVSMGLPEHPEAVARFQARRNP